MTADKDATIKELRRQLAEQSVIISTLRGLLFTGWSLTNCHLGENYDGE